MRCKRYASILILLALPVGAQEQRASEACAGGGYAQQGYCPAVLSSPAFSQVTTTGATVGYQVDRDGVTTYICCAASPPSDPAAVATCAGGVRAEEEVNAPGSRGVPVTGLQPATEYACAAVSYQGGWPSNVIETAGFETESTDPGASVVFADTFDSSPDWDGTGQMRCRWWGDTNDQGNNGTPDCQEVPDNYDFAYVDDRNSTNPMCSIRADAARGGAGKGLRVWDESNGDGNNWGSDCQLAKTFHPVTYPELWASYYVRYNPEMQFWGNNITKYKTFRIGYYRDDAIDGSDTRSVFATASSTEGLVFLDAKRDKASDAIGWQALFRCSVVYQCGPNSNYYVSGWGADDWATTLGDGEWHHIEIQVRWDSAPGAADGRFALYYDGTLIASRNNVTWRENSSAYPNATGFNTFTIAGNGLNNWAGSNNAEQWVYDVDDVRICTERCP